MIHGKKNLVKPRETVPLMSQASGLRPNLKKSMVYGTLMSELTITSPYVYSRVDSSTFTIGNPMPESTLNPQLGTLDLASVVSRWDHWLVPVQH